jgi:hypothetical protein
MSISSAGQASGLRLDDARRGRVIDAAPAVLGGLDVAHEIAQVLAGVGGGVQRDGMGAAPPVVPHQDAAVVLDRPVREISELTVVEELSNKRL